MNFEAAQRNSFGGRKVRHGLSTRLLVLIEVGVVVVVGGLINCVGGRGGGGAAPSPSVTDPWS